MNAANAAFRQEIQDSFDRQGFMHTIGAALSRVEPGEVHIRLALTPALGQQNGFGHAGAIAAIADTACGYSALSLMAPGEAVLTTEFKVNLLAPGSGEAVVARARIVKAGRTLTVSLAEVFALKDGLEQLVLLMTATNMALRGRPGLID